MTSQPRTRLRAAARATASLALIAVIGGVVIALVVVSLAPVGTRLKESAGFELDKASDPDTLPPLPEPSLVYAADGTFLAKFKADVDREPVSLAQVPMYTRKAVMAAEDDRFYEHDGVSARSIARALVSNVNAGGISQGGSTITQQVVKTTYFIDDETGVAKQNLERKAREAMIAMRIERKMSKDAILERYLNTVYLGWGAYGFQSASKLFFNKSVDQLGVAESALLAGAIASPSRFDPYTKPDQARQRRDWVLGRMQRLGWITWEQYLTETAVPLPTVRYKIDESPTRSYFVEAVKQELLNNPTILPASGATPEEQKAQRVATVFKGGLRITTTLDPTMQRIAEETVERNTPQRGRWTAALASIDVDTGAVKALYGGRDFADEKFNLAYNERGRQPGSSFKTFGLVAALEKGYSPSDIFDGTSGCAYKDAPSKTVKSGSGGAMSLAQGTTVSSNCVYVNLVNAIGAQAVVDEARKLGIERDFKPFGSIILGGQEVSPLEMATAYGTIANDGVKVKRTLIQKVTDAAGTPLFEAQPGAEQVVDPNVARATVDIMKGVLTGGTAAGKGIGRPAAGKTGTTQNNGDAWFVGFTPQLATAVWTGNPDTNRYSLPFFGGGVPASIWQQYMREASQAYPVADWAAPNMRAFRGGKRVGTFRSKAADEDDEETSTTRSRRRSSSSDTPSRRSSEPRTTSPPADTGGGGDGDGGDGGGGDASP